MNQTDSLLLIFGILTPLVMLLVVSTIVALTISVLLWVYYRTYKAHMINTHPDKVLLEEIRRQY